MEPAQSLTWIKFDRQKLYASIRDRIRGKTLTETIRQPYRYECTARSKDRDSCDNFENGFTL
jgi:hypothetical protein